MDDSAGPSRPKRGRPGYGISTTRVRLRMDAFDEWQARKDLSEFSEKTHSEFAEY